MARLGCRRWKSRYASAFESPAVNQGIEVKYLLMIYDGADTRELFSGPGGKSLGEEIDALTA